MKRLITIILLAISLQVSGQVNWTPGVGSWQLKDTTGGKNVRFRSNTGVITPVITQPSLSDSLKNYAKLQDGLISGGSATIGTGSVTIDTAYYRLNDYLRVSLPRTFTGIANSPTGTQYYLVVYGNTSGILDTISGTRDTIAVIPDNPINTIKINTVLVGDGGVESTNPDLSGYALLSGATFTGKVNIRVPRNTPALSTPSIRFSGGQQGLPDSDFFRINAHNPATKNLIFTRLPSYEDDLDWIYDTGVFNFRKTPTVNGTSLALTSDLTSKANDADVVHKTGNETIEGIKTMSNANGSAARIVLNNASSASASLTITNTSTGSGLYSQNTTASGNAIYANNTNGSGKSIYSNSTSTGDNIVANRTNNGFNFLGQNGGVNTFSVDRQGVVTASKVTGISDGTDSSDAVNKSQLDLKANTDGSNINQASFRTSLGLGSNAYTSTAYQPALGYTPYNPASYPVTAGGETLQSVTNRGGTTTNALRSTGVGVPSGGPGIELYYTAGSSVINSYDRNASQRFPMVFYATNYAFNEGNVGIGAPTPSSKLQVNSTATNAFAASIYNLGTGNAHGLYVSVGEGSTGTPLTVRKGSTELFTVTNTGNANITGTVSAAPATASNHLVTKAQLDAISSDYVPNTGNTTIAGNKTFTGFMETTSITSRTGVTSQYSSGSTAVSMQVQSGAGAITTSDISDIILQPNNVERFRISTLGVMKLSGMNTAPASATATGSVGEIRITATHIYVCTATNTWVRTALTTW